MEKQSYFSQLPIWAKGTVAIAVVAGAAFAGYKIYGEIKNWQDKQQSKKDVNIIESDLDKEIKAGNRPKYSDSQYSSWASSLAMAFDGCGATSNIVLDVFSKLKNKADVLKLIATYGTRKYGGCLGTKDKEYTLSQALADEMQDGGVATINNILRKNGVNFQF